MKKFVYNRILLLAIAAGLLASLVIAGQRHAIEIHNMQIDMVMDFDSVKGLAEREGADFNEVLQKFKDAGITSLAIYDTNLDKLTRAGKVIAVYGSEIINHYHSGSLNSILWRQAVDLGVIYPNRVYIVGRSLRSYEEAKADIMRRFDAERIRTFSIGEVEVLEVKAQYGIFMTTPIGFDTDELDIAKNAGFMIVARPKNFLNSTPENIKSVFERLDGYPISEIVFDGPEILGAPDNVDATAAEFKRRGYVFGMIENPNQLQFYNQVGMFELARQIGYNKVARLFAIPIEEQPRLFVDTAVTRFSKAARERNIRIALFRTNIKNVTGMNQIDANLQYINANVNELRAQGYSFGKASTLENYYPNKILRVLVIIGIVAAGVLYLSLISKRFNANQRLQTILFVVLSIAVAIPILMGAGGKVRMLAALLSAILFPVLAIIWQLDKFRFVNLREQRLSNAQIIWVAFLTLIITSVMSMVGAAYLSGALSDVEYLLELEFFRGIKLTLIMPLIMVGIAFLQRFNIVDEVRMSVPALQQLKEILNLNVTVKSLLALLVVIAAFVVLIARSGHTSGMPVSDAEIQLRAMLDNFFYVRPRSKEIFLGHPAFILAIVAFLKNFPKNICLVLILIATLGQSSMVETFAHMKTPIFMSFMRGVDGVIPGALIGIILVLIIEFTIRFRKGD